MENMDLPELGMVGAAMAVIILGVLYLVLKMVTEIVTKVLASNDGHMAELIRRIPRKGEDL